MVVNEIISKGIIMNKLRFDRISGKIILFQIAAALCMMAAVCAVILFLSRTAEQNARDAALQNAETSMRLDVDNVIARIEMLSRTTAEEYDGEIRHLSGIFYGGKDETILTSVQKNAAYLNPSGRVAHIFIELTDGDGAVLFNNAEADAVPVSEISEKIDHCTVRIYTTQAAIDAAVKSEIHDEIHNTEYNDNQYVWVNEVVSYAGGDNYAIRRIHPNLAGTEGIYLSTSMQDAAGNYPYASELAGILDKGEIFQSYYFQNMSDKKMAEKYSYARLYRPYNWIIATGIPYQNLYAIPDARSGQNRVIAAALMGGFAAVILLLTGFGMLLYHQSDEKKKAEERANYMLLSSVSHDMRTPMNAIVNYSGKELTEDLDESGLRSNMLKINEAARQLMTLINDLLTASKLGSTSRRIMAAPVSIRECFQPVCDVVLPRIIEKKQHFSIRYSGIAPECRISADAERLHQIFVNLINNASKYTPEGGSISCEVDGSEQEDRKTVSLTVHVRDNGIGIEKEKLPVIFRPFTQIDGRHSEGIGLGLAIVKELVEAMHGSIRAESTPGRGSDFIVQLSFERAGEDAAASPGTDAAEGFRLGGMHVLIAEDNQTNAEILSQLLKLQGVSSERAENGRLAVEAFEHAAPGTYDAILMDIRMPVMDGIEAARTIRQLERADAGTIRIIAMTADALPEDAERCFSAGMDAYVTKPIQTEKLYRSLSGIQKADKAPESAAAVQEGKNGNL